ncbi:MAG: transcriptional repressor NrdR [Spirochaetales bacterium]|nr:transcriptional repressor NrdR [Spirochaetales bacterium]
MKCPHCGELEDKVIESRSLAEGTSVRRRRECLSCGYRFTSYERIEERILMVVKTNGRREPFSREKLERGIQRAVEKRNISQDQIESLLNTIEDKSALITKSNNELPSRSLGDLVLSELQQLDDVAYIRFASVYRKFENLEGFIEEIQKIR